MQHKIIANAKQGSLGFFMPRKMTIGDFREACSLWIDGVRTAAGLSIEQVNCIFNHGGNGQPRNDLSPYRFGTDGDWGLVHALGDDAIAVVKRLADVAMAGSRLPAALAAPRWEDRNVGVMLDGEPMHYWIPEMIVCRDAEQYVRWMASTKNSKLAHVEDLLGRGLQRQVHLLGLQMELPRVEVTSIQRERVVPKLRAVRANALVRVASIGFTLPAALHGHWAAGALINRGFGAIYARQDGGLPEAQDA